jgi:hypothetical protein
MGNKNLSWKLSANNKMSTVVATIKIECNEGYKEELN